MMIRLMIFKDSNLQLLISAIITISILILFRNTHIHATILLKLEGRQKFILLKIYFYQHNKINTICWLFSTIFKFVQNFYFILYRQDLIFELNIAADVTEWNLRLPVEPLGGNNYTRRTEPYNPDEDDISKRPVDKFLQHYQVRKK